MVRLLTSVKLLNLSGIKQIPTIDLLLYTVFQSLVTHLINSLKYSLPAYSWSIDAPRLNGDADGSMKVDVNRRVTCDSIFKVDSQKDMKLNHGSDQPDPPIHKHQSVITDASERPYLRSPPKSVLFYDCMHLQLYYGYLHHLWALRLFIKKWFYQADDCLV